MRKKYKKYKKNKTVEVSPVIVESLPEVSKTPEPYIQERLFQAHDRNVDIISKETCLPKNDKQKFLKYLYYFAGAFVLVLLIWYLVFPFVVNTGIVKEHLESILSNKLNVKVETGKVKLSNWGKNLKVRANDVNLLSSEDDSVIAYIDGINFEFSPFYIFFGEKHLKNIKVSRLDIPLPVVSIQKFMLSKGYLSRAFYNNSNQFKDDSMSFQNIDIKVNSVDSKLQVDAVGDCEITFFKNTAFEFSGIYDPKKAHLKIDCFHLWGNRIIDLREFKSNTIVRSAIKTPIRIVVSGEVTKELIDLPEIHLMVDLCQAIIKFKKKKEDISFDFNIDNQDFPNAGRLFKTRSQNEKLKGVDLKIEAHASADNELVSKGSLTVRKGTLRGVPFENVALEFMGINDRITTLKSSVRVWNGFANINLVKKNYNSKNELKKNLVGNIYAYGIDINESLSSIEKMPALTGGELTLKLDFDFENLGIGEFLSKKLPDFNFDHASGTIILSNAYLSYFSNQKWLSSPEFPKLIKDYFGITESIAESSMSIPLLNKFIKELALNKPRTMKTSIVIENGKLSTPELLADTPVGKLIARGSCDSNNVMNYKIQLRLDKKIYNKYNKNPILSLFRKNEIIELPIILSGELGQPDIKLNLSYEKRIELEEKLTEVIAAKLSKSMKKRDPNFKDSNKINSRIKKTIRGIINKLL